MKKLQASLILSLFVGIVCPPGVQAQQQQMNGPPQQMRPFPVCSICGRMLGGLDGHTGKHCSICGAPLYAYPPHRCPQQQQQKTRFPGPQQQGAGIGSRVQGRYNILLGSRPNSSRTGRANYRNRRHSSVLKVQNSILLNRRQKLRNYRSR